MKGSFVFASSTMLFLQGDDGLLDSSASHIPAQSVCNDGIISNVYVAINKAT